MSTEILTEIEGIISSEMGLDTETTGLWHSRGDKLFSIILSNDINAVYLNYNNYPSEGITARDESEITKLRNLSEDPNITWYMQNAKFDMHMMAQHGVFFSGKVYDLKILDRLHFNQHKAYSLDAITKRWDNYKDDAVKAYIKKHKLNETIEYPEYRKEDERLRFDLVPHSLIAPYGKQDALATIQTAKKVIQAIKDEDAKLVDPNSKRLMDVVEMETKLLKVVFNMEHTGIKLDIPYCKQALEHYRIILEDVEERFKIDTGIDFKKGTSVLEEIFTSESDKWEKTEKGNWKWDKYVLAKFDNPLAERVIEWSESKKQFEYFANFLFYSDKNGILHPSFDQSGAATGRFSSQNPNMQNLTNPDKYDDESDAALYPVRKSFIPRDGYFFAMPDYSQVEFRLMLEYAKAMSLISEINNKGLDVHTATANVAGVTRKEAKTCNFLTVYGGGVVKLATSLYAPTGSKDQLGAIYKNMFRWRMSDAESKAWPTVTDEQRAYNEPIIQKAYDVQQSIFRAAPEIKSFLKRVQSTAELRGYVKSWVGRILQFPDKRFCYRAPNHLIQGGASEVVKIAMINCADYLADKESRLLLTIHDELIFEVKYGEEYVVDELKSIMEKAFPSSLIPLLVDCEFSTKNLGDKLPWVSKNV